MNRVEIRIKSVEFALKVHGMDLNKVFDISKMFEEYIIGDADIPEYEDQNTIFKEMVNNLLARGDGFKKFEDDMRRKYGIDCFVEPKEGLKKGN